MTTDPTDLPLATKVRLLSGHDTWTTEAVPDAGIVAVAMADGPHGLRHMADGSLGGGRSEPATCFPTASLLGATWDPETAATVGRAIAAEAAAQGVDVVLGPGVNIKRHPYCGRNFEYLSEDPHLSGALATAFVRACQDAGVGTSVKHYAANNQEGFRMTIDAIVDERTLRELYLPAFEHTATEGGAWTIMCAYNRLNGPYCAEHEWLLTTVLRDEWGWDGVIVTDWGANNDRVEGVRHGQDLEMPSSGGMHDDAVIGAVTSGALDEASVDRSVARLARLAQRVEDGRARRAVPDGAEIAAHHALARRVAADGMVLLRNDGDLLPVSAGSSIALVGAFAERPRFQGVGSSKVEARRVETTLDAMTDAVLAAGGTLRYAPGYHLGARAADADGELLDAAASIAGDADVAVVLVGLPDEFEAEGADRTTLALPGSHDALVRAVQAANPNTVVVCCNGAPVAMPWRHDVPAVLEAYLGGQAGGAAIADVVLGAAEPGGRLAESFPVAAADLAADAHFPGTPDQVQYREGLYVGYRWHDSADVDPAFCFGHGLSYTTWDITEIAAPTRVTAGETVTITATVTNTGHRAGSQVVQVYVHDVASSRYRPFQELAGFAKVRLGPGESTEVAIPLRARAFSFWDPTTHDWVTEPGDFLVRVGTSSRAMVDERTVTVAGDEPDVDPSVDLGYRDVRAGHDFAKSAFEGQLGHPVPSPPPRFPLHRNTTLADLGNTTVGAPIWWLLRKVLGQAAKRMADGGALGPTLERAVGELPVRNLSAMSGGKVPIGLIDRVLATATSVEQLRNRTDDAGS